MDTVAEATQVSEHQESENLSTDEKNEEACYVASLDESQKKSNQEESWPSSKSR